MGQCCRNQDRVSDEARGYPNAKKQNKNIDDKRILKVGIEVLKKDFCVQIGYNRRAVKTYSDARNSEPSAKNENIEEQTPEGDDVVS